MSTLVDQWFLCAHHFGHCTDAQHAAFHISLDILVEKINLKIRYRSTRKVADLSFTIQSFVIHHELGYTYPGAVDEVVYPLKLLSRSFNHSLHAQLIRDVHLDGDSAIFRMFRKLLAFFCGRFDTLLIDIRKDDADSASFGKCICCLLANASGCLKPLKLSMGNGRSELRMLAPVISATPLIN